MIIIVEGIDRVGKTTLINKLTEQSSFVKLKDYNITKDYKDENFDTFSLGKLDTSFAFLKQLHEQGLTVIVDRLHLTELVYAKTTKRRCCEKEIYDLDRELSKLKAILIYVEPTDIHWSNEQANEDQTQRKKQFDYEYTLSHLEKYNTNFNEFDSFIPRIIGRLNETNRQTIDSTFRLIIEKGAIVNNTKELVCNRDLFSNITTGEIINTFRIDKNLASNFKYDSKHRIETFYGPYEMEKYFGLFEQVEHAVEQTVVDNEFTRRSIIQFDSRHCFQNVQFLIRNNSLILICNMRSCNFIENYENDVLICSLLADEFKELFALKTNKLLSQTHTIILQVGSLHIFTDKEKEDDSYASES